MQNQYQDKEKRKALALEIAREAMVLLKNDDGMLPLPKTVSFVPSITHRKSPVCPLTLRKIMLFAFA